MYVKLYYKADPANTIEQLLDDYVRCLTGVVFNDLSTQLGNSPSTRMVLANSYVETGYTLANYVLHDDISTTQKVLSIPIWDDVLNDIYIELNTSGDNITATFWEGWTLGAGTGASSTPTTVITATSTGSEIIILWLQITDYIVISRQVHGTGIVNLSGWAQHEREEVWDTIANGRLPIGTFPNGVSDTICEVMPFSDNNNTTRTQLYFGNKYGNAGLDPLFNILGGSGEGSLTLDANKNQVPGAYEMRWAISNTAQRFSTGRILDMYFTKLSYGGFGDTMDINVQPYQVWDGTDDIKIAIRRG